jgi:osmotically inducible protein OsmC
MQRVPRIERAATAVWEGSVARGNGRLTAPSTAFVDLPFSLPSRTAAAVGTETSPEELLAAAHAACFAMALSSQLTRRDAPPQRLTVTATVALDEVEGRNRIVGSSVEVRVEADALAEAELESALADADARCPFSALIRDAGGTVGVDARIGA